VLTLVLIRRLVESPRWYESRGEYDRADAVLREIEEQVAADRGPPPEPAAPAPRDDETEVTRAPLRLLLQKRYLKRRCCSRFCG
jgi:putative MFS transporter